MAGFTEEGLSGVRVRVTGCLPVEEWVEGVVGSGGKGREFGEGRRGVGNEGGACVEEGRKGRGGGHRSGQEGKLHYNMYRVC